MKLRPPALPLINIDTYFSIWSEKSVFENTVHWTGKHNTICGRVYIDNSEYHFLGLKTVSEKNIPDIELVSIDYDAFSTIIIYKNENIRLKVIFTSPMLVDDLYYASRPIAYCNVSYENIDRLAHEVSVKFTATEELVLNNRKWKVTLADKVEIPTVTAIKIGNSTQKPLSEAGDETLIDWGYLYLAIKGKGIVEHTVFNNMYAISAKADLNNDALFLFAYDDTYSIQYFGENLVIFNSQLLI